MPKHSRESGAVGNDTDESSHQLIKKRKKKVHKTNIDIESLADSSMPDEVAKESTVYSFFSYQRLQNIAFAVQLALLLFHLIWCCMCVTLQPNATFLVLFHGVVSPICAVLHLSASLSLIFCFLAIYRRESVHVSIQRQAQWYRRHMRMTKFVLLLWILSSCTTIFGCWMYNYAIHMEENMPINSIYATREYISVIKQILIGVSLLQGDLEHMYGITSDMQPLKTIKFIGQYFYLAGLLFTVVPSAILFICVQVQRKYYAYRFSID